jgi:hypothetical protein
MVRRTYNAVKYFIDYQENTGTKYAPAFAPRLPFMSDFPFPTGYFAPAAGDLNQDGRVDFLVCCDIDSSLNLESLLYYRNDPSGGVPFNIIDTDSLRLNPFVRASIFFTGFDRFRHGWGSGFTDVRLSNRIVCHHHEKG